MPSFRKAAGRQQEEEVGIRKSLNNFIFIQRSSPETTSQLEKVTVCPKSGLC